MAFVSMSLLKALLALQIVIILLALNVDSHSHAMPPVGSPIGSPMGSPIGSPVSGPRLPVKPIRSPVAVQGVVYCKSCKYTNIPTLMGAKPLLGAIVSLQCNNGKRPVTVQGTTDKNGYYFILAPKKVSTYGHHKCRVVLVSSPSSGCKNATNFNWGVNGAFLVYQKQPVPAQKFTLYTVAPLAFAPTTCPK